MDLKPWSEREEGMVRCGCGAYFRAKHQIDYAACRGVIDRPCPACGRTDRVFSFSFDPEVVVIRGSK